MQGEFFLVGPTALGKSRLALDAAEEVGAEIVNADAFQIYRGLDILTAKPDARAQRGVPHHLLSVVELNATMSAAKFRVLALQALDEIRERGSTALIVSGSGLYVKALTHGFDEAVAPNMELRAELSALSLGELVRRLLQLDPELAAGTDVTNARRVIRAIEIAESNATGESVVAGVCPQRQDGRKIKRHPKELRTLLPPRTAAATTTASATDMSKRVTPGEVEGFRSESLRVTLRDDERVARGVFLVRDRDDLYRRINERVHAMFREGVEAEVAALKNVGPTAAQALGLRQIQQLLAGHISRDDCIAKVQQATRRYAKRQLTWFRHQTNFPQLNLTALSHQEAVSAITRFIAQE